MQGKIGQNASVSQCDLGIAPVQVAGEGTADSTGKGSEHPGKGENAQVESSVFVLRVWGLGDRQTLKEQLGREGLQAAATGVTAEIWGQWYAHGEERSEGSPQCLPHYMV